MQLPRSGKRKMKLKTQRNKKLEYFLSVQFYWKGTEGWLLFDQ